MIISLARNNEINVDMVKGKRIVKRRLEEDPFIVQKEMNTLMVDGFHLISIAQNFV